MALDQPLDWHTQVSSCYRVLALCCYRIVFVARITQEYVYVVWKERLMDDGLEDESGEDAGEDASAAQRPGLMASAWSFITTFFTSLIPEGPPQVAN